MFSGHVVQKNRSRKKFEQSALFITHLGTNQVRSIIYIMITILIRRQAKVKHATHIWAMKELMPYEVWSLSHV